jgi:hypothetical protein
MDKFRVWLIFVLLIFGLVQIYQWLQTILLPLPIYLLGGAFLSIASNLYPKVRNTPLSEQSETPLISD